MRPLTRSGFLFLSLTAACFLTSCGGSSNGSVPEVTRLAQSRAKWRVANIRDYSYVGETQGLTGSVRLRGEVRNGQLTEATVTELRYSSGHSSVVSTEATSPLREGMIASYGTIEAVFASIQRNIEDDSMDVYADYDPATGRPIGFAPRPKHGVADGGGYHILTFEPR